MLDTTTKKRIDDCRDILVGKLPDPKAQIEQITIGLIYKFMDDMDKESVDLGGEAKFFSGDYAKYSWDALFDSKVTASEMLKLYSQAIESMEKNPAIPQLFRDIFNNAYLPYRDPETLKLFLKTIGEFEYTHSEKLGDAFEYLLSVMGSQGDAGQFRTPRHIIDFLVRIVDPQKTDTILDPACGTAGFLISAFKHIKSHAKKDKSLTPDEQKRLINNFVGYDISPDMVRLSLVNLYLHGFSEPHIHEYDALSSEDRWNESYDVILANPPFMSPKGGIRPHKKFTVKSNRSEVLFVDYIAEHLNPKGRAGVIVPEGVIFQSGKAYKELRKILVENYLYAVVSLPAGVFNPYSGVKTSILLMDKELAKKSDEILFVKIENDGYNLGAQRTPIKGGQLEEAIEILKNFRLKLSRECANGNTREVNSKIEHSVLKTEIAKNGEYNLSGERYKTLTVLNSKYEHIALKDLCNKITDGSHNPPKGVNSGYLMLSSRNVFDNSLNLEKPRYLNKEDFERENRRTEVTPGDVLLTIVGTIGRSLVVKDTHPKFTLQRSVAVFKTKSDIINSEYLSRIIQHDYFKGILNKRAKGVAQKGIYLKELGILKIPLPPLSVQEEIVAEIEGYQKIIDGAKMVVDNYKPRIDIDPDWEMVEFANAPFKIIDGDRGVNYPKKNDFSDEGYCLFLNTKNVRSDGFNFDELMFISKEKDKALRKGKLQKGDVLLTTRGTVGNTAYYSKIVQFEHVRINSGMLIFRTKPDKLHPEYLYYFIQSENCQSQFKKIISGAAQPQLPIRDLNNAKIPIPELNIQIEIVEAIKKEQALVSANLELQRIFRQKIKSRIVKVWGE